MGGVLALAHLFESREAVGFDAASLVEASACSLEVSEKGPAWDR